MVSLFNYSANAKYFKSYLLALMTATTLSAQPVRAEFNLAFFSGKTITDDGDLNLTQGNTNMNFRDVEWEDRSFESPIYYGARLEYWFNGTPNWGLSVDYTHMKNYLVESKTVAVDGVRNGVSVSGREPIENTIDYFNMSHGLNTVTFNGHYRWFPAGQRDSSLLGRMQLYTALGAGFSIPHVEATINGVNTHEYQGGAGPVLNGMMGVNYDIWEFISGFVEYKLTYADVEAELKGGGSINTETVNHQIAFGVAAHFDL